MRFLVLVCVLLLNACTSIPDGVEPVTPFDSDRYLGTWYEIARFDHSFERGLSRVTATYSKREDGGIKVLNRGYSAKSDSWDEAEGRAYFVSDENTGHLKVSFFGPFYASYVVAALDQKGYEYALVSGPDFDYLWILARTPTISDEVKNELLDKATELGFDISQFIFVDQSAQ